VYVHVPFCARRCSYCDFSIAVRRETPVDEFISAIHDELAIRFPHGDRWNADTLYVGGGTPSRLGGEGVRRLLGTLTERIVLGADAEVTLEANPDDVTAEHAAAWVRAGVNRVSVGVQSFDDRVLAWMHRTHDAARAIASVRTLRDAGITNVSVDLIFALPAALERDWARDLDAALALEPDHISLYGLTVEPHTPLGRWVERGVTTAPAESQYEAEYLLAHARLTSAGFEHYEVSNFGRPGRASRHNACYWDGAPYAGIGPAAHGYDGESRRWNAAYASWTTLLRNGADPVAGHEVLSDENRAVERVYLGLRTRAGASLAPRQAQRAATWVDAGWASLADGARLTLSPEGWLRLDELAAALTVCEAHS
jgi:oxygen-independent coproporphyrinogen-3 oxidase